MKQRFGIAQLLLNQPRVIIVDEPTAGLDPAERTRFLNVLRAIGSNNIVIFSTHLVEDVKALCQDMAIIDKGTLLFVGSPGEALAGVNGHIWEKTIAKADLETYNERFRIISTKLVAGEPLIHIYSETPPGDGFLPAETTLEDVFFSKIFQLD